MKIHLGRFHVVTPRGELVKITVEMRFADGTLWTEGVLESTLDMTVRTDEAETIDGGGTGGDTYIWNLGDGSDRISDFFGDNELKLGDGITPEDIHVTGNPVRVAA